MKLYDRVSANVSRLVTRSYSSSFSLAIRLLPRDMARHVSNIYGLVRVADEIVDTYRGPEARLILDELEQETYRALKRGYSANPVVHSFVLTAREHAIGKEIIKPFFASMRTDITRHGYTPAQYKAYVYGSGEVIGMMCLRIFCKDDHQGYEQLESSAMALGSAFQKINFLRDVGPDNTRLGRMYFPGVTFASFDEAAKQAVIKDIRQEFREAEKGMRKLPPKARPAVVTAYRYYAGLLRKIEHTPVEALKVQRVSLGNTRKLRILAGSYLIK